MRQAFVKQPYTRQQGIAYLLLSCSVLFSAIAQLLLKAAVKLFTLSEVWFSNAEALGWLVAGLSCYAISMLSWLVLLARWPLSLAYPMISLSYVLVYLGATHWPFLGETATASRSAGIIFVIIGVILVNFKAKSKAGPKADF